MSGLRVLLFGGTGMIGGGVLRALLSMQEVDAITSVSRTAAPLQHPKLTQVLEKDMEHMSQTERISNFDVCLFCLGATSVGMSEEQYRRLTVDLTLSIAKQIAPLNPKMIFEYVSGERAGDDAKQMWRRVKGEAERAVLQFGFYDAYIVRPGFIQPMRGTRQRNLVGRLVYSLCAPFHPWLKRRFPNYVTNTDDLARVMIDIAVKRSERKTWSTLAINHHIANAF